MPVALRCIVKCPCTFGNQDFLQVCLRMFLSLPRRKLADVWAGFLKVLELFTPPMPAEPSIKSSGSETFWPALASATTPKKVSVSENSGFLLSLGVIRTHRVHHLTTHRLSGAMYRYLMDHIPAVRRYLPKYRLAHPHNFRWKGFHHITPVPKDGGRKSDEVSFVSSIPNYKFNLSKNTSS